MMQDEDAIIAKGLKRIREGLLEVDWSKVSAGYELISGEKIVPSIPTKSRLENIRSLMNTEDSEDDEDDGGIEISSVNKPKDPTDWSGKTVKELLEELDNRGVKKNTIKSKKKADLLELISLSEKSEEDEEDVDPDELKSIKLKGGKVFGQNFSVITDDYDPKESLKNQKLAKKKSKIKVKRNTAQRDNSTDENADSRFYNNPPKKAPWH